MDRTWIQCPSCNRNICIALKPPLCSLLPIDLKYSYISKSEEYTIEDLIYVHEELIRENKLLRNKINELQSKLYPNRLTK